MAIQEGFWPDFSKKNFVLAPMEGVTDAPMRELLCSQGAFDYAVSEFVRVSHEVVPEKVFYEYLPELRRGGKTHSGQPVLVQLLGGNAERLAESAKVAVGCGALGIDLNFGCPAQTVNRHDGGATLLKFPERIEAIVGAVRQAVPSGIPVSAKLRLGWDDSNAVIENAKRAERGGANWLTLHARTRLQGYQPPVDWQKIGEVRPLLSIPVIANGDIWGSAALVECGIRSRCSSFMLGRGAVVRPEANWPMVDWNTREVVGPSEGGPELLRLLTPYFLKFVEISGAYGYPEKYILKRLKQWMRMVSQFRGDVCFDRFKVIESLPEMIELFKFQ